MKLFGGAGSQPAKSGGSAGGVDTLIGRQTEILGDVRFAGGLYVDGKIKGKVLAAADQSAALTVSETGSIEGDVRVPTIVLNGIVTGDVHAPERITLAPKARVTGNVYYRVIEMQSGAQVNGHLVYDEGNAVAAITHELNEPRGEPTVIDVRELRRA